MPVEPDTPKGKAKRPKKDQGASLLRWSREELELITAAAEKADQPLPVYLRRTILRDAAARTGLAKSRLRGNQGAYVNKGTVARDGVQTCSVHKGEPLYVTAEGPACRLCSTASKAVAT